MNGSGPLHFDAYVGDKEFNKTFEAMERRVFGFTEKANTSLSSIESTFVNLGRVAAGAFAINGLSEIPAQIVRVRGEFQQLEISLNTMLRSKAKADQLMAEVVQLAASTPFGLKEAAQATKQLLAYGSASTEVVSELRMLGDVAAGVGAPLGDIAYLYGTLRTQGKAFTVDIRQFAGRGIPIYEELSKVLKVSTDEVSSFVEQGKVGFKEVQQAFRNMSGEGGAFENLMAKQSASLTGLTSQFSDAVDIMLNDLGKSTEGVAAMTITAATGIVENYEPVLKVLTVMVATYGTYKTALAAVAIAQRLVGASATATLYLEMARGLGTVTTATYAQAAALGVQTQAQAALNAVMAINPYVAAATAIVALAGAVWLLSDNTTAAEVAQKSYNSILEEQKKKKEDLVAKTSELTGIINSSTSTTFAQIQAYSALQKLYPAMLNSLTLQEFKLLKAADAQKQLNAAMDQMGIAGVESDLANAQKKVDDLTKKVQDLKTLQSQAGPGSGGLVVPIADAEKALEAAKIEAEKFGAQVKQNTADAWEANTPVEEQVKHYEDLKKSLESQRSGIEKNITALQKAGAEANNLQVFFANMSLLGLNQQLDQVGGKLLALQGKPNAMFGGNKGYWEKISSEANENRNALGINQQGSAEWKRLTKEIDEAEKHLKIYNKTKEKAEKKVAEKDKPQPFGSLAYYEQIARKADEIISKTPGTNTSAIAKQNQIKIEAEKKADEIRKSLAVKSFEQELEEKKKAFEQYQRWIDAYGQESADNQFKALISSNKNYVSYLDGEIRKLESLKDFTPLNAQDTAHLLNLRSERTEAIGGPTVVDQYRDSLQKAKEEATSLTEYLGFLKRAQEALDASAPTSTVVEQKKITAEAQVEAEKERKRLLSEFLLNTEESEAKRLEVERYYGELRSALDEQYNDKKTSAYQQALDQINKAEAAENQERKQRIREASDEYKYLVKAVTDSANSNGLFDQINKQKDLVANELAMNGYSESYFNELRKLGEMQKALYQSIASAVGQLGEALRDVDGALGKIGSVLSGVAGQANNLITVFDKNASATEKWGSAAQAAASLISMIATSTKQRRQAESEYYASVIAQQSQYNILLNEGIGMQSELNGNVFLTNYEGKIVDGIRMMADAQAGYEKSLEELEKGRAKIGQRNKVDWGAVGSGAASGAAIGAAIGTAIPVIGNVVGGVVGGIVGGIAGFFGGKKKADTFGGLLDIFPELVDQAGEFNKALAESLIANNLVDASTKVLLEDTIAWTEQLEKAKSQIESVIIDLAGGLADGLRDELVGAFEAGTSAAEAWGSGVSKILKDLISQVLFSKIFQADFDKLQKEMEASYGVKGDQNFVDDIVRFYEAAGSKAQSYIEALNAAQQEGEKYGLDLFSKTSTTTKDRDPLAGAIKGMDQQTAGVLVGQFNALRISGADSANSLRQSLLHLTNISNNSNYLRRLEGVENALGEVNRNLTKGFRL